MATTYAIDACLICRGRLVSQILGIGEGCLCLVCGACDVAYVLNKHPIFDQFSVDEAVVGWVALAPWEPATMTPTLGT